MSFVNRRGVFQRATLSIADSPSLLHRFLQDLLNDSRSWQGLLKSLSLSAKYEEVKTPPGFPLADATSGNLITLRSLPVLAGFNDLRSAQVLVSDCYIVSSTPAFLWIWDEKENQYFQWDAPNGHNPTYSNPTPGSPPQPCRLLPIVAGAQTVPIRLLVIGGVINVGLSSTAESFTPIVSPEQVMISFIFTLV